MHHKKAINAIGWTLSVAVTVLYAYTMYPVLSFWDSGEYITTSATLQVGHPPGAPLYQLIGAFFSIFCFNHSEFIAPCISFLSALSAGFGIMFFFWISVRIMNRFSSMYVGNIVASCIGSLCLAFMDSYWFSATEAEVYSLAFLFSIISFWAILRWDESGNFKWILLVCFLTGLSVGVHQLCLLVLPAIVLVIYFHRRKTSFGGMILYIFIACLLLALLQWIVIPLTLSSLVSYGILKYLAVLILFCILSVAGLKKNIQWLHCTGIALFFLSLGMSTYIILPLRANNNLPLNQYKPNTAESLNSYIHRDNYLKAPLIYGQYFTALPPEGFIKTKRGLEPVFASEQKTFFPRMWNYENLAYENGYIEWVGLPESHVVIDGETRQKPSFRQNLRFFFSYQVNYMYLRYLLWNFSGRTNDVQGYGDYKNSQWMTGIGFIDSFLGIGTEKVEQQQSKAHNVYFAIPLLLALFGIFYHINKDSRFPIILGILFFFTSLALVIYLNQEAYQARERDYTYLLSFAVMALWLAIGVLGISQIIANIIRVRKPRYVTPLFLFVPIMLFAENIDDHNHHNQKTAYNFAVSMLNACEENAVLFTNGDNDTYPLWYAQNVEKIRTDVRVINIGLLNSDKYIDQLFQKQYLSSPLKTNIAFGEYKDKYIYTRVYPDFGELELNDAIRQAVVSEEKGEFFGQSINYFKTNKFYLVRGEDTIRWSSNQYEIGKADLMVLDIIASNINDRPIYFSSYSVDGFYGLDSYLYLEGFAYRLGSKAFSNVEILPLKAGSIDAEKMYYNFIHKFKWDNFDRDDLYYNEIERIIVQLYIDNGIKLAYKLLQTNRADKALVICNMLTDRIVLNQWDNSVAMADLAVIYSFLDHQDKADFYIRQAVDKMVGQLVRYNGNGQKQQAQERLEIQSRMYDWLRLILQSQDWGLEQIRIALADSFFYVVGDYLQVTHNQIERMRKNYEYYEDEILKAEFQMREIYSLAATYEETLPVFE